MPLASLPRPLLRCGVEFAGLAQGSPSGCGLRVISVQLLSPRHPLGNRASSFGLFLKLSLGVALSGLLFSVSLFCARAAPALPSSPRVKPSASLSVVQVGAAPERTHTPSAMPLSTALTPELD